MKKNSLLLSLFLFSFFFKAEAQWSGSTLSGNTYRTGNVGIGISSPQQLLTLSHSDSPILRFDRAGSKYDWEIYSKSGGSLIFRGGRNGVGSSLTDFLVVESDGDVTIGTGTTYQSFFKLAVNGKIRAKEVKVETGWPDFVFEDDYYLPTLKEVEEFIQKHGHLPEIPSAKEVEADGVFLGEMNAKLLQKIEELTLYMIELKRENEEIKELLEEVGNRVKVSEDQFDTGY